MRFTGTLTTWHDDRGFGFIEPAQGGQEIFAHIKAFPPGTGRPRAGLPVSFELELGPQGKKRAKSIEFVRQAQPARAQRPESPAPWTLPRVLLLPVFAAIYYLIASHWHVSRWVAFAYGLGSFVTFFLYVFDKAAARAGRWRTKEDTLHAFGLACGWPGALVAQQLLRHKTAKDSFVATFWMTVVLNIALFTGLHSPYLKMLLR